MYHSEKSVSIENSDNILNEIKKKFDMDTIFIVANEPTTQPELSNHIMRYAIKKKILIPKILIK